MDGVLDLCLLFVIEVNPKTIRSVISSVCIAIWHVPPYIFAISLMVLKVTFDGNPMTWTFAALTRYVGSAAQSPEGVIFLAFFFLLPASRNWIDWSLKWCTFFYYVFGWALASSSTETSGGVDSLDSLGLLTSLFEVFLSALSLVLISIRSISFWTKYCLLGSLL